MSNYSKRQSKSLTMEVFFKTGFGLKFKKKTDYTIISETIILLICNKNATNPTFILKIFFGPQTWS